MKNVILITLLFFVQVNIFAQKKDTITSSGLKYTQLKAGKGKKAVDGQTLKVKFVGKFKDGEIFEEGTFEFVLGKKEVIPGFEEGFKLMRAGEKGIFTIPAKLAYGKKGSKGDDGKFIIPPDADLIFEIKLLEIK